MAGNTTISFADTSQPVCGGLLGKSIGEISWAQAREGTWAKGPVKTLAGDVWILGWLQPGDFPEMGWGGYKKGFPLALQAAHRKALISPTTNAYWEKSWEPAIRSGINHTTS